MIYMLKYVLNMTYVFSPQFHFVHNFKFIFVLFLCVHGKHNFEFMLSCWRGYILVWFSISLEKIVNIKYCNKCILHPFLVSKSIGEMLGILELAMGENDFHFPTLQLHCNLCECTNQH